MSGEGKVLRGSSIRTAWAAKMSSEGVRGVSGWMVWTRLHAAARHESVVVGVVIVRGSGDACGASIVSRLQRKESSNALSMTCGYRYPVDGCDGGRYGA